DRAGRPRAGAQPPAHAHRRRAPDPDRTAPQRAGHVRARRVCGDLSAHSGGDPMTELAAEARSEAPAPSSKGVVLGGRVLLLLLLLLAWEVAARRLGSIFFAPPLDVATRIVSLAQSGKLVEDVVATLRVSAFGFAIACVAGVLLPFLLRRSPRVTAAVEPYI